MKRSLAKARYTQRPRLIDELLNTYKKWVALAVLLLFAWTAPAQGTDDYGVIDNGSKGPACPNGVGGGSLKAKATCHEGESSEVKVYYGSSLVYRGTSEGNQLIIEQVVEHGGEYKVTLSCNNVSKDYTIWVGMQAPTATISQQGAGSMDKVCNNDALTLVLTGTPYSDATVKWGGPGTIASSSAASTTVTNIPSAPDPKRTYTYTMTKAGCPDLTASASINVIDPPTVDLPADIETCQGATVAAKFTVTNATGNATFYWTNNKTSIGLEGHGSGTLIKNSDGKPSGSITSFIAVGPETGPVTAELSVSAINDGCASTSMKFKIIVNPKIQATLSSDKPNYCSGETITLSLATNIGDKFTWSGPQGFSKITTIGGESPLSVSIQDSKVANSGEYSVTVDVGNPVQCSQKATTRIIVNQGPDFTVKDQQACEGQTVDLTDPSVATGAPSGVTFTYWIDPLATNSLSATRITSGGIPSGKTSITKTFYIKANGSGCPVVKPVNVTFTPSPTLKVTNPTPVCSGPNVKVDLSKTVSNSPPGMTYTYWKDAATTTDPITANPPLVDTPGTTMYYIKGSTGTTCTVTASVTVKINASPAFDIANPPPICTTSNHEQINLVYPGRALGAVPVDDVNATSNPYSYFTDQACTQSAGTPTFDAGTGYKLFVTLPDPNSSVATNGVVTFTYYIKAKKTYPNDDPSLPANVCTTAKTVTVQVQRPPTITIQDATDLMGSLFLLCGNEKRNLTTLANCDITKATLQFFQDNQATKPVADTRAVGEGTYYIRGNLDGCLSPVPLLSSITLTKFASPTLALKDVSICVSYDVGNDPLHPIPNPTTLKQTYSLEGMLTDCSVINRDGFLFSNTDAYKDDYPFSAGGRVLTLPTTATEANTGVIGRRIFVQGKKTYTNDQGKRRGCFSPRPSATVTVKPLPRVGLPSPKFTNGNHKDDFLCSGGKTNMTPIDLNLSRYPPSLPGGVQAKYTWVAQECDGAGVVANPPANVVTGETNNSLPSLPPVAETLTTSAGSGFHYVKYTYAAVLNECTSQNTDYIIVPVADTPAPIAAQNLMDICGAAVTNGAPTATSIPLHTTHDDHGIYFNWEASPEAVAAGGSSYTDRPGNRMSDITGMADPIAQTLTNSTKRDISVSYKILPFSKIDNNGHYCLGEWNTTTVVVHPVPTITAPAADNLVACNGNLNTVLGSDVTGTKYYWTTSPAQGTPNPPPPPPPLNPPTPFPEPRDFKDQTLNNTTTTTDQTVTFTITPNYGYSAGFVGCSGTSRTLTATLHPFGYPVLTPQDPFDICAVPAGTTNSDGTAVNNVNISLSAKVAGKSDATPTYTWTIGGDCYQNNVNLISGFAASTSPSSATTITASLGLPDGKTNTTPWRHTTDHALYYDITPTYEGCVGGPVHVKFTLHPDPYIKDINYLVTPANVCSGDEIRLKMTSYYPDNTMTYSWYVPLPTEGDGLKYKDNPANLNNPANLKDPRKGDAPSSSPLPIKLDFNDKKSHDIIVDVTPYHTYGTTPQAVCFGPVQSFLATVQPRPTAQAISDLSNPAAMCVGDLCKLTLSSPTGVENTLYKWEPVQDGSWSALLLPSNYTTENRPAATGPITDQWKLKDNKIPIDRPIPILYNITPYANNCVGATIQAAVTVYPIVNVGIANMTPSSSNGVCSGSEVAVSFKASPSVVGTKFTWVAVFPNNISGMTSQLVPTVDPIVQTIYNNGKGPATVSYIITPEIEMKTNPVAVCKGNPFTKEIIIQPIPDISFRASSDLVCSGKSGDLLFKSKLDPAVSYSWSAQLGNGGVSGCETGDKKPFNGNSATNDPTKYSYGTLVNNTKNEQSIGFTGSATATYGTGTDVLLCKSNDQYISLKVAPAPKMKDPAGSSVCSGDGVYVLLSNDNMPEIFYTWTTTPNNVRIDGTNSDPKAKSIGPINGTLTLTDNTKPGNVLYDITPHSMYDQTVCDGDHKTITIAVNPLPPLPNLSPKEVCSNEPIQIPFTFNSPNNTDASYYWSNNNINTGLGASGIVSAASGIGPVLAAINEQNRDLVSTITITPKTLACVGVQQTTTLTLHSAPTVLALAKNLEICGGSPEITLSNPNTISGTRYLWTAVPSNVNGWSSRDNKANPADSFTSGALVPNTVQQGTVIYTFRAVGANGCVGRPAEPSTTITVKPVPQAEATPTSLSLCPGDKAVIRLSATSGVGGKIPAVYTWTVDQVDNLKDYTTLNEQRTTQLNDRVTLVDPSKGGSLLYKITPSANGCSGNVISVGVSVSRNLRAPTVNPTDKAFCIGSNITLLAGSSDEVTYRWYSSQEGDVDGTWELLQNGGLYSGADTQELTITNVPEKLHNRIFKAELTDKNCPNSSVQSTGAKLTELLAGAAISAHTSTTPPMLMAGQSVSYTYVGPSDGTTYLWDFGDGWKSKEQQPVHFYNSKGIFETHLLVDKAGCVKNLYITPVTVKESDSYGDIITADRSVDQSVSAYPVPVSDQLTIEAKDEISKVEIRSSQGALVLIEKMNGKKVMMPMHELAAGIYVLTITHESGITQVKVVKY